MAVNVPSAPDAGVGGIFKALLPDRAVEDVLRGRLQMVLGEQVFVVPVLKIAKADEWRDRLAVEAGAMLGLLAEQPNGAAVMGFLGQNSMALLALIRAYDASDVLPTDDWVRENATEPEVVQAFVLCMAASYPFISAALDILAANPGALRIVLEEFGSQQTTIPTAASGPSLTSSQPATAGPSNRSARRSRTSSSRAT